MDEQLYFMLPSWKNNVGLKANTKFNPASGIQIERCLGHVVYENIYDCSGAMKDSQLLNRVSAG